MAKVLFVDDRIGEVLRQWQLSYCSNEHKLLPLEPFVSLERTCELVRAHNPDVVLVGHGLGHKRITGVDVILALRQNGYKGYIIANSGGGVRLFTDAGVTVDGNANRDAQGLKTVLANLKKGGEQ